MRNLKKLVTIIVTVAIIASMFAVPALAEETADALKLEAIGVLNGTGNGVDEAYRASVPTRYQVGWLFLRLLGKAEAAKAWAGSLNFKDAATAADAKGNKLNAENQKMLGYLYAHQSLGYKGYADDTFRPFVAVNAQMYYKLMLVALGYVEGTDFTWDTVFDKAIEIGLLAAAPAAGEAFDIDALSEASVKALNTNLADGSKTLIAKLVDDDKAIDAVKAADAGLYGRKTYSTALDPVVAEPDIPGVGDGPPKANQLLLPTVLTGDYAEIEFDMSSNGNEGMVGFADKDMIPTWKWGYAEMSLQVRMTGGAFDVRNGGSFKKDAVVNWVNDEFYHVRARVNFTAHTYSVWVNGVQIAKDYAFRSTNAAAAAADDLGMVVLASGQGGIQMKNLVLNGRSVYDATKAVIAKADVPNVGPGLENQFYFDDIYSGKVTLTWKMTALADAPDGGVGFVAAPVTGYFKYYPQMSIYVAMAPNFKFINGGVWVDGPTVVKGQTYDIKVVADTAAHTYDVYVDGVAQQTGLAFRTRGQNPVDTKVSEANNFWMVVAAASADNAIKLENLVVDDNREFTKVLGISANDMGEIHVAFDRVVTADKFTNNNLTIDGVKVTELTLDADGKGLLAVVPAAKIKGNGETYTVKILKAAGLEADYTDTITTFDQARPVVVDIKTVAPNKFAITFSEILDSNVAGTITINNGIFGVSSATISGKVVTVQVASTTLPAEELDVKISGYQDLSKFVMAEVTKKFTPVKDEIAPTVNVISSSQTEVVLEFNEDVVGTGMTDVNNFYHTFSHYHPNTATMSGKKITLTFTSYPLPAGSPKLTVLKANIEDTWGNKMAADVSFDLTVTADVTAPTVTKPAEFKGASGGHATEVWVTFSEAVTGAGTVGNYTVKLGSTTKAPDGVTYADKVAKLYWNTELDGGTYTIEIKNIKDTSLNENPMAAYAGSFDAKDSTLVYSGTAGKLVSGTTNDIIYLTYKEAMNDTVLDASYYLVDYTGDGTADAALNEKTVKIERFGADGKVVKITRAHDASLASGAKLQIGRVQDAAGNTLSAFFFTADITNAAAPSVTAINQTAADKISVVFDSVITTYSLDAFEFKIGGKVYKAAQIDSISADGKTISLTMTYTMVETFKTAASGYAINTALTLKDVTGLQVYLVADKIVSNMGTKSVATDITAKVADKRAPQLIAEKPITFVGNVATVKFSEDISATNDEFFAFDLEVKKGTAVQQPITKYTTAVDVNGDIVVTFTESPKDFTFTLKTTTYIKGADGNAPAAFTNVKCVAP